MARIRTIKPQAFTSRTLSTASVAARWTFAGLWTHADDAGRAEDDARIIKGAIWPQDDDVTHVHVAGHLDELAALGLLCRYTAGGKNYLHVTGWDEHQPVPKPSKPRHPECPKPSHRPTEHSGSPTGDVEEPSRPIPNKEEGKGRGRRKGEEGKGRGSGGNPTPPPDPDPTDVGTQAADATSAPPDAHRLCDLLARRIAAWSGKPAPTVGKAWLDAARLLLTHDDMTAAEVEQLIDFATSSDFWRPNIVSMPKLRKQRLTLLGQMRRPETRASPSPNGRPAWQDHAERRYADALAREAQAEAETAAEGGKPP